MNPHFYKAHARLLSQLGYPILPIVPGEKRPAGGGNWTTRVFDPEDPRFSHCGIGIRCGIQLTPDGEILYPIDVDIAHEGFVKAFRNRVFSLVGEAPIRIGRYPRELILLKASAPDWPKLSSASFSVPGEQTPCRVEFLGKGQQFVSHHIHPDTGSPYVWTTDILDIPPDDIPVIDLQTRWALLAIVDEVACQFPEIVPCGAASSIGTAFSDASLDNDGVVEFSEKCQDITLENCLDFFDGYDESYDSWLRYGMALHHQFDGSDEALDVWDRWSQTIPKYDGFDSLERRWRGFGKTKNRVTVSFKSVIQDHLKAEEKRKDAAYQSLLDKIRAFDKGVGNAAKFVPATLKELRSSNLTPLQEELCLSELKSKTGVSAKGLQGELKRVETASNAKRSRDTGSGGNDSDEDEKDFESHHALAKHFVKCLTESLGGVAPVTTEGQTYLYDELSGIWSPNDPHDFAVVIPEYIDATAGCARRGDYLSIGAQAADLVKAGNESFFDDAPIGLASSGMFYYITADGVLVSEPLSPNHRQRATINIMPEKMPTPLWDKFLLETFTTEDPAHKEQIAILQEVFGAVITGSMSKYEKAVLLFGGGRAGKSTVTSILEHFIPKNACTNIQPCKWNQEYYLISLHGAKLNLVGELDHDDPIPFGYFKAVTGRDEVTGRNPTQRPVTFRPSAAHIFASNHLPPTTDRTSAFFSRWIIIEFPNSRLLSGAPIDTDLAKRISASELPGILYWALEGASRLQARKAFKLNHIHDDIVSRWRSRNDSVLTFLTDACELRHNAEAPISVLYGVFREWCYSNGLQALPLLKFSAALEDGSGAELGVFLPHKSKTVKGVYVPSDSALDGL